MNDHDNTSPYQFAFNSENLNAAAGHWSREMLDNLRYDYLERKSQDWQEKQQTAAAVLIVAVARVFPDVRLSDFNITWKDKTMLVLFRGEHFQFVTSEPGKVSQADSERLAAMIEESALTLA